MSDNNTAPADSTKPAACGACRATLGKGVRHASRNQGYEHQLACECGASSSLMPSPDLAIIAWDAMWAPRAGEATKRVAAAMRDALGSWAQSDRLWINYEDCMGESVETADVRAMFAELGLAGGEGRG